MTNSDNNSPPEDDNNHEQQMTTVEPEIILTDIPTKDDTTKETNTINTTQSDYPLKTCYSNDADYKHAHYLLA
jgi:hypothetical protein